MAWNRDKKAWRGEAVKLKHTVACKVLGGEKSWRGEAVKLRHTLARRVLAGKFKK